MISIQLDGPDNADVRGLLDEHLADMRATSLAESVHALDHSALKKPEIAFRTVREDVVLLGCGALKHLAADQGEIKSMRRVPGGCGYRNLYLESGSDELFAPARRLYCRHGFAECELFAEYVLDPCSVFMQLGFDGDVPAKRLARP